METEKTERDLYICEMCGEKSFNKEDIERCEAGHRMEDFQKVCDHKYRYITFVDNDGDLEIMKRCHLCNKRDSIFINDCDLIKQSILEEIFNIEHDKHLKAVAAKLNRR